MTDLSLVAGTHDGYFKIDSSSGAVRSASIFDYEDGISEYGDVFAVVTDATGHTASLRLSIVLNDLNEHSPVIDVTSLTGSVEEGLPHSTSIDGLTITASDDDTADKFSWSLSGSYMAYNRGSLAILVTGFSVMVSP
jgi:hypothetical protein